MDDETAYEYMVSNEISPVKNSAINFTDDLYIKGYMLKGKERNYYHPMIVLLMSEDVKFDEFFL